MKDKESDVAKPPSRYPHPGDLDTFDGIARVHAWLVAHLEHASQASTLASNQPFTPANVSPQHPREDLQVGPLRIQRTPWALSRITNTIINQWHGRTVRYADDREVSYPAPYRPPQPLDEVDAVRVAGNYRDAAALIRSQLARQSDSMDEADVERCERMAERLETAHRVHLPPKKRKKRKKRETSTHVSHVTHDRPKT